ncbi:MAG: hypothetical protein ACO1SV_04215 [Fimbriimonas sp.]
MRFPFSYAALLAGIAGLTLGCGGTTDRQPVPLVSAYAAEAEAEDAGFYLVLDNSSPDDAIDGTFIGYAGEELLFADVSDMTYNGTNLSFRMVNVEDPTDWATFQGTGTEDQIQGEWAVAEATRALNGLPGSLSGVSGSGTTGTFQGRLLHQAQLGEIEWQMVTIDVKGFQAPPKKGKPGRANGHFKSVRIRTGDVIEEGDWTGDYSAGTTIQTTVGKPLTIVFDPKDPNGITVRFGPSSGRISRK